jgi:hypothetical protein
MDKDTRNAIERCTQRARRLLAEDFATLLEGSFDIRQSGEVAESAGPHLSAKQKTLRNRVTAAIDHKISMGMTSDAAVKDFIRDASFTTLNRFVALKMLEQRGLVQECITRGTESRGFAEFCLLAEGLKTLPNGEGYRLYLECIFDELSAEIKVLFDRRDPASALWPGRQTFEQLLALLNAQELEGVWSQEETIGWVYQFFNSGDERREMREKSQAPRNSRELAVRNQFFTPRYVVQFLTDNTLGRIWFEMQSGQTKLASQCEYMVNRPQDTYAPRPKKDPRDIRILDPACGSGHFLLYAFDLLATIYEEAWIDAGAIPSEITGHNLRQDYPDQKALKLDLPGLVLRHNLHGVDIDPRCAQIAQLALWLRAQKAFQDYGIPKAERPLIRRANIVIAEPMPGEKDLLNNFMARLENPDIKAIFGTLVESMTLAGDLGLLLRPESLVHTGKKTQYGIFTPADDEIRKKLEQFLEEATAQQEARRRLFAEDSGQGLGLVELAEKKYDVVLMNPPFGSGSMKAKKEFEKTYPKTKNDIYAAFVERGIELLHPRARLGAITSRTGFFLSSFQKWREEVILTKAPPVVFADLGYGVLDSAMVETAAYCLEVKE